MKKIVSTLIICSLMIAVTACKKWKDLEYADMQITKDYLQANVKKKGGQNVLWFQIFDQIDEKATVDSYKSTNMKVDKYPAKIYENKWIWMLVNNRMEIRLIADDSSQDFKNTGKLKDFIQSFDLSAMEKVKGEKMESEGLKKFIPKLGNK